METNRHERMSFPAKSISVQPDSQFRVLTTPACKILVKPVHCNNILPEKTHIATLDSAQTLRSKGGENGQSNQVVDIRNISGYQGLQKSQNRVYVHTGEAC